MVTDLDSQAVKNGLILADCKCFTESLYMYVLFEYGEKSVLCPVHVFTKWNRLQNKLPVYVYAEAIVSPLAVTV